MLRPWLVVTSLLVACSSEPIIPLGDAGRDAAASAGDSGAAGADARAGVDAEPADALPSPDAMAAADTGGAPDAAEAVDVGAAPDAAEAVDVGAAPDAAEAVDVGAASGDAGAASDAAVSTCVVDGIYAVTFSGMLVYFSFDAATGRWGASETRADLPANPLLAGSFTFSGGVLALSEDPGSSCPPTDVGAYTATFDPTCTSFTLALSADPCAKRAMALDGAAFGP